MIRQGIVLQIIIQRKGVFQRCNLLFESLFTVHLHGKSVKTMCENNLKNTLKVKRVKTCKNNLTFQNKCHYPKSEICNIPCKKKKKGPYCCPRQPLVSYRNPVM